MAKNGKCKAGSYWCYTDKKCKKIPAGFMIDREGMLRKENGHTQESEVSEAKDHEVAMAQSQLDSAAKNIKSLKKKLGKKEKDIPAWMQAKITDTAHNMDAASGYDVKEMYSSDRERARRYAEYETEKKAQYKRNMRMKHGKNWKEFTKDAKDAKDRLRPGEVRTFNKKTGKWESNKD